MRAGRKLRVDALDRSNETELAQGTVLTVDNQIDAATGTVRVRATFTNKDYKLFPNEFVNARLLVRTLNNVNLIPTAAIQRNNEVAFVYLADPKTQTVHVRNINIATTSGITAAVTGVSPGDVLVTDGFDRLTDGSKVVTRSSPPGGAPAANTNTLGPAEAASNGESQSPSAASATPANSVHKRGPAQQSQGAATNAPQAKQQ
jgi:membrane fusion protein, multidrug efflux system